MVAAGSTTHSLTLYRAASGALVFGAGTINWGWGLDQYHDGDNSNPADSRMQQATLNMLADMGVLPSTLMSGLSMPSASTDTAAPALTLDAPANGATMVNGTRIDVSGTALDSGGGRVTAVEVSLDGGTTWHRATGTTSWSYSDVVTGVGTTRVMARATDDSANLSTPVSRDVTVTCPCTLFGERVPETASVSDTSPVELGVKFVPTVDGYVSAIRFFKGTGNSGTHTGHCGRHPAPRWPRPPSPPRPHRGGRRSASPRQSLSSPGLPTSRRTSPPPAATRPTPSSSPAAPGTHLL